MSWVTQCLLGDLNYDIVDVEGMLVMKLPCLC